jgi:hypothetical protein
LTVTPNVVTTGALPGSGFAEGVKTRPSRAAATVVGEPETVQTPIAIVLLSAAAFGSESVPLAAVLDLTVAVSV